MNEIRVLFRGNQRRIKQSGQWHHPLSITKNTQHTCKPEKSSGSSYLQLIVLVRPLPLCCGSVCVRTEAEGSADEEQVRLEAALRCRCC